MRFKMVGPRPGRLDRRDGRWLREVRDDRVVAIRRADQRELIRRDTRGRVDRGHGGHPGRAPLRRDARQSTCRCSAALRGRPAYGDSLGERRGSAAPNRVRRESASAPCVRRALLKRGVSLDRAGSTFIVNKGPMTPATESKFQTRRESEWFKEHAWKSIPFA